MAISAIISFFISIFVMGTALSITNNAMLSREDMNESLAQQQNDTVGMVAKMYELENLAENLEEEHNQTVLKAYNITD